MMCCASEKTSEMHTRCWPRSFSVPCSNAVRMWSLLVSRESQWTAMKQNLLGVFQEFARNAISGKTGTNFGEDSWSLTPYNVFTYEPASVLPGYAVLRVWESKPAESSADAGASREPRGGCILPQETIKFIQKTEETSKVYLVEIWHAMWSCWSTHRNGAFLCWSIPLCLNLAWVFNGQLDDVKDMSGQSSGNPKMNADFRNFRGLLNAAHISGCIWKVLPLTAHRHRCPFFFWKEFQQWRDFPGCFKGSNKQWKWFMKRFKVGWT